MKKISVDYLIVGSGAGGSTVFENLACRGKDVLLVEEGPLLDSEDKLKSISDSTRDFYRDAGATPVLGTEIFSFSEGRLLGGTTELNGGLFWRTPPRILENWENLGMQGFSREGLEEHFVYLENSLSVRDEAYQSRSENMDSRVLANAALEKGWKCVKARRAVQSCERRNRCGSGCPSGAKQSMSLTMIPRGKKNGGQILTSLELLEVKFEGNFAKSALCRDVITRELVSIEFGTVFLSAGAVQTPKILKRSCLIPGRQRIGFHLNTKILAKFPFKIGADEGTIFTEQVQEFMDSGILFMATNFRPEYLAVSHGNKTTQQFLELLSDFPQLGLFTLQVRPSNYGTILTNGKKNLLNYSLCDQSRSKVRDGLLKLADLLFLAGAEWIELPVFKGKVKNLSEAEHLLSSQKSSFNLSSVHAMSTLPMGIDSNAWVSPSGNFKGFKNFYISDASVLPTTIGESPQATIMAIARSIAANVK
jgi:choline dehydrogenase-like flavoprotein